MPAQLVSDLCQYVDRLCSSKLKGRVRRELTPVLPPARACLPVYTGGAKGILIVQVTQSITILGGGAGYMLAANNYIAELVPAEERTASFGVLQGIAMAGTSVGQL